MNLADRYRKLGLQGFARWVLLKRIGKPIVRSIDRFMASQSLVGNPVRARSRACSRSTSKRPLRG
jgi:hypothetical protein